MVEKYFVIFRQKWKGNYSPIFRMFRIAAIWKLLSENIHDSFFYFQNLSFSFSTIWRNDRKVLYNFHAEMKQRAIILPSFELEQFGACYREISAILPTRFGEWTKMVEKYFIIFRQRWNKRQSFFHFSNVSNRSNLEPAIGKCSFYIFPPLSIRFTEWRTIEKYLTIFKHVQKWNMGRVRGMQEEDCHPDHAHPLSRERNHRDDSPCLWKGFVSAGQLPLGWAPDPSLGVAQKSSNSDEFCNNDRATAPADK